MHIDGIPNVHQYQMMRPSLAMTVTKTFIIKFFPEAIKQMLFYSRTKPLDEGNLNLKANYKIAFS